MTKNKMLALFGGLAVVVLGAVAYIGTQGEDNTAEISAPPTLEQSQSLTGSLSVDDRWFTVDNSATSGGVSTDTTDSNFFIFTLGPNFSSNGIDDFKDNIVVSSGEEGFVLGTFEDNRWKLSPEKNYLGARLLQESELRACGTYFLIKIHHDRDKSPKASFDISDDFVSTVTAGSENCSADQLGLKDNQWNLVSTRLSGKDAFKALVDGFEYLSVWDTFIINQSASQANTTGRQEANLKQFLKTDGTDELDDYFSSFRPVKQDMWVYLGNVAPVVQNKVPSMTAQNFTVDPNDAVNGYEVGTLVASGGDGELEFSRLGGSDAFTVSSDGKIVISDLSKLGLSNNMEVQVAERATPADKAAAAATVKVDLTVAQCKNAEEFVSAHIKELEGALQNSSSFEEAPYLLNPLPVEVKNVVITCSKFKSETGVSNEILEQAANLEAQIVAAGAQTTEAVEQAVLSPSTGLIEQSTLTQQSAILPLDDQYITQETVSTETNLTESSALLNPDSGYQQFEEQLAQSVSGTLVSLEDCLKDPLGDATWVDSSTKLSEEFLIAKEKNQSLTLLAVIAMNGCDSLLELQHFDNQGQSQLSKMDVGVLYEISNNYAFVRDASGNNSVGKGSAYIVRDSNGNVAIFFGEDDQGFNPLESGVAELEIGDGLFWYNDQDLNGDFFVR